MNGAILDFLVFTSLGMVGMGVIFPHIDKHFLRAIGYLMFGAFWALRIGDFYSSGDLVNTFFVTIAFPFFAFLAYQEYLVYKGKEPVRGMEMLSGAVFFGGLLYFVMAKFPPVSGGMISIVAEHSTWLANIMSGEYVTGELVYGTGSGWYTSGFSAGAGVMGPIVRTDGSTVVNVIFACTGVQSILIFVGPILFTTSEELKQKLKVAGFIALLIYVLNLFRNAGIITLIDTYGYSGEVAHDIIGKFGSIGALFVLAFIVFKLLPGLLDDVDSLILLFTGPNRQKQRSQPEGPSLPLQENQEVSGDPPKTQ